MKKLLGIVVLGLLINSSAIAIDKSITLFKYFKPLDNINMSVGASVTDSYYSLKKHLTLNCSILFGENMDKHATINMNVSEQEVLNYAMTNKVQFSCQDVKYKFLDKNNKETEKEILIIFVACGGVITEYNIETFLPVQKFGKDPSFLSHLLDYYRIYSSKDPVVQKKQVERKFMGEKNKYDIDRRYWSHDIIYENDKIGYLFIDSYIEKNTKYEWDNGTNNVGFKSIYYPKVTSKCF